MISVVWPQAPSFNTRITFFVEPLLPFTGGISTVIFYVIGGIETICNACRELGTDLPEFWWCYSIEST